MSMPVCQVGDYGRCTCSDGCRVLGEVVSIGWDDAWTYTVKWYFSDTVGPTYDSITESCFEVTAITIHPLGICEIPL